MKNWQKIKQNPELKAKFLVREQVFDGIRTFFKRSGFHEVETPLMVKHPGTEPYLEVFATKIIDDQHQKYQAFLLTSPEYAMKKLIAGGMGNIFQICKSFRNGEGLSERHNPEFTILEWYRTEASYLDIMTDVENLILFLHQKIHGTHDQFLTYQGKKYDLSTPFTRISVSEAFNQYLGIDEQALLSVASLKQVAVSKGYEVNDQTDWEALYNQLFLNEIEPKLTNLTKPVILYDYPASQAALAKRKTNNPDYAERFEVYLAGLELGNAFSELTDAAEQQQRFEAELALRKKLGKTEYGLDMDYLEALKTGLPPTGGIAVGVDRLVMLMADVADIKDTIFFPATEIFSSR